MYKVGDKLRVLDQDGNCSEQVGKRYPNHYIVINRARAHNTGTRYTFEVFNEDDESLGQCEHPFTNWTVEYYGEQMPKRTFKLRKDAPSMLKGALLQDNGNSTSPYILINSETHSKDPSYTISYPKRELVEEAPAWFVEVFAVTPPYMTQSELDQYETFKQTLKIKAAKPAKTKKEKKA